MPAPPEALIFLDLDGTIEDSREDMSAAVARVRAFFGLDWRAPDLIRPHVNRGMEALYLSCFDELLPPALSTTERQQRLERIRAAYESDYALHIVDHTRAYPDIPEAIAGLSKLAPLICYTNKPATLARLLLDRLSLGGHFRRVIGGDSFAEAKPSAVPMRFVCKELHSKTDPAAIMVGDSNADAQAAANFGCPFVWCAWGYQSEAPTNARVATAPAQLVKLATELLALPR